MTASEEPRALGEYGCPIGSDADAILMRAWQLRDEWPRPEVTVSEGAHVFTGHVVGFSQGNGRRLYSLRSVR